MGSTSTSISHNCAILRGLDRQFRDVMLAMSLDIEHFAKARLLHELTLHADEDGYSVVADYREELKSSGRMYMENELRARKGTTTAAISSRSMQAGCHCGRFSKWFPSAPS